MMALLAPIRCPLVAHRPVLALLNHPIFGAAIIVQFATASATCRCQQF
jgi:hypothetical protein